MPYANNKGTDQPAHPRSLISAFVIRCLDSIIPILAIGKISRLASFCGCAGRFESYLVGNPEDRVSHDVAVMYEHSFRVLTTFLFIENWENLSQNDHQIPALFVSLNHCRRIRVKSQMSRCRHLSSV